MKCTAYSGRPPIDDDPQPGLVSLNHLRTLVSHQQNMRTIYAILIGLHNIHCRNSDSIFVILGNCHRARVKSCSQIINCRHRHTSGLQLSVYGILDYTRRRFAEEGPWRWRHLDVVHFLGYSPMGICLHLGNYPSFGEKDSQ